MIYRIFSLHAVSILAGLQMQVLQCNAWRHWHPYTASEHLRKVAITVVGIKQKGGKQVHATEACPCPRSFSPSASPKAAVEQPSAIMGGLSMLCSSTCIVALRLGTCSTLVHHLTLQVREHVMNVAFVLYLQARGMIYDSMHKRPQVPHSFDSVHGKTRALAIWYKQLYRGEVILSWQNIQWTSRPVW